MKYPEIAQRVFHTPLLAAPSKAAAFVKGLGPRLLSTEQVEINGVELNADTPPSNKPYASLLDNRLGDEINAGSREAFRILEGAAVIPITGSLIHRGAWIGSWSGETSYEGIAAQIDAAVSDRSVRGIALEIDSFGGEVAGCFDLADRIREARQEKPVWAFIADHAFSAAFALASQADRVILPRAGGVGSIGVICLHVDYSQRMEDMGARVTVISAGEHKGDANPYEPLPDDVRENLEAEMESLRGLFAETVGAGRGDTFSKEDALATEAACFLGQEAVDQGLADEVASPREAFGRFIAQINGQRDGASIFATSEGPSVMSKQNEGPKANAPQPEAEEEVPEQEIEESSDGAVDEAAAETETETGSETEASGNAGSAPEASVDQDPVQRIQAILYCEEAVGQEELAKSLAFNSAIPVSEARKHLAAGAKGGSSHTPLSDVMADAGVEADLDVPPASGAGKVSPMKASVRKITGK